MTRPSRPNVDVETVCAASGAALAVRAACPAPDMAAVEASTRDVTTADAAMMTIVMKRGLDAGNSPNIVLLRTTVKMQGNSTHVVAVSSHVDVPTAVLGGL